MKRVSVEQAFVWAQQFVAREWRLLVPVALAFMALPPLLVDLLAPASMQMPMVQMSDLQSGKAQIPVQALVVGLVLLVIGCVGQLALVALGLVSRISVREALGVAVTRLAVLVAAWIMVCLGVMGVTLVVAILLSLSPISLIGQGFLLLCVVMGLLLFAWVRLVPLEPVIVERPIGPIAAIRRSWALSHGVFWRSAGALLIYAFGASIVVAALSSALGAILTIAGKAIGQPEVGIVLAKVLTRIVWALGSAGLQVVVVGLYRQIVASRSGI